MRNEQPEQIDFRRDLTFESATNASGTKLISDKNPSFSSVDNSTSSLINNTLIGDGKRKSIRRFSGIGDG